MSNLDTKISEALADETATTATFNELLIAIDSAIPINIKESESTKIRMLDPTYPNPAIARSALSQLELEKQRLESAQVVLKKRYAQAERRETRAYWQAQLTPVLEQRNAIAQALISTYRDFLGAMLPLLAKAEEVNRQIRHLRHQTSGIDNLPLLEEIVPRLLHDVRRPDPNGGNAWPTPASENAFAVAMSETMVVPRYDQRYSADWAEAKKAEDKAKLDYWEKRNALQAEQQAEAKREFEKSKQQGAR
jgi:hypothetical protein